MSNIIFRKISSQSTIQKLLEPMKFDIILDSNKEMSDDIEFEIIYSVDPKSEKNDQKICSMLVGPIPMGKIGFSLETDCLNIDFIDQKHIFGVTSVIIIGKYNSQQFLRIGYIINVRYPGIPDSKLVYYEEDLNEEDIEISQSDEEEEEIELSSCAEDENEEEQKDEDTKSSNDYIDQSHEEVDLNTRKDEDILEKTSQEKSESNNKKHGIEALNECVKRSKHPVHPKSPEKNTLEQVPKINLSEIQNNVENNVFCEDEKNQILVNNLYLDKTKIEIEFMEPPVITIFEIDWDTEQKQDFSNSAESE